VDGIVPRHNPEDHDVNNQLMHCTHTGVLRLVEMHTDRFEPAAMRTKASLATCHAFTIMATAGNYMQMCCKIRARMQ